MICYRDITFCPYYLLCKKGYKCDRALTNKVQEDAHKWWGEDNAPIAVYSSFPDCFVRFFEDEEE